MKSETYNQDCLAAMREMADNAFDLAIVDPPYGIDINTSGRLVKERGWAYKDWDSATPNTQYFTELRRVSVNQIIWGGNYFELGPTRCYLIWDKEQPEGVSFASAELAWTSFDQSTKTWYHRAIGGEKRIHPTQKPVALYKWLLTNYAKQGDTILDTHLGSGSSRIAAYDLGFDFTGYELDTDYFNAQEERYQRHIAQGTLFTAPAPIETQGAMFAQAA